MSNIPVGYGLATLHVRGPGITKPLTWSIGYKPTGAVLADPSPHAATIRDCFSAAGGPYQGSQMWTGWIFDGVTNVETSATGPVVGASIVPVSGTISGESPPCNSALLMTKYTARGGRRGRGRAFLPLCGLLEGDVTAAGICGSGQISAMAGRFSTAITQMGVLLVPAMLLHSPHRDPLTGEIDPDAPPPPAPDAITSISISTLLATQRRRMR